MSRSEESGTFQQALCHIELEKRYGCASFSGHALYVDPVKPEVR
jgi:hypothetical protein